MTTIGLIAALMLTAMAFAAEEANQPPAAVEQPLPMTEAIESEMVEAQEVAPVMASAGSLQTIAFKKDMPIADALKMLAQMYQKNIIPSAKVAGNVTVGTLYDVTFEEALQAILGTNKYDMNGNFIRVYTLEEYKADKTRLDREAITLFYINAEEAGKLAKPLLSEMGQIGITTAAAKDMEVGKGGDTLANRDMIVISDYPENIKAIREMIAKVDVAPPQVLIDVTVMEASLDETTQFGIDFDSFNGLVSTSSSDLFAAGQEGFNQGGFTEGITSGLSVGILTDNVKVFIKALDSITDTTLLANPKILALNKQAGMVMIGDRVGYITTSEIGAEGATQQVEFLEGGTRLSFRPYVCDNGLIRMEINPKQSTPSVKVDGGFVLPNEKTTEVTTNVMVRDGKTIVLGGLFKEKTTLGRSQTPLLGDLPIIGYLFKGVNDKSERVELIVLVTPHIISEPEQADGATRMQDVERLAYRARQNITWLSRAKIDEARYANAVKLYSEGNADAALAELEKQKQYGIDRTYLDPIRLEEKIIKEKQPDKYNQIERIMVGNLEKEQSGKWQRR